MMDKEDEGLDRLTDLDVTWAFDQDVFLRERSQETPSAGVTGDETLETMDSFIGPRWTPSRSRQ